MKKIIEWSGIEIEIKAPEFIIDLIEENIDDIMRKAVHNAAMERLIGVNKIGVAFDEIIWESKE